MAFNVKTLLYNFNNLCQLLNLTSIEVKKYFELFLQQYIKHFITFFHTNFFYKNKLQNKFHKNIIKCIKVLFKLKKNTNCRFCMKKICKFKAKLINRLIQKYRS